MGQNGIPQPVSGIPPPVIAVPPPKLSLHHLMMPFHHHNIFGQLIFGKIITTVVCTPIL